MQYRGSFLEITVVSDSEANRFASDLDEALTEAGWIVQIHEEMSFSSGRPVTGVEMVYSGFLFPDRQALVDVLKELIGSNLRLIEVPQGNTVRSGLTVYKRPVQ